MLSRTVAAADVVAKWNLLPRSLAVQVAEEELLEERFGDSWLQGMFVSPPGVRYLCVKIF